MASSPLLAADSSTITSPSPFNEDVASTMSPLPDDVQLVSTGEDGDREKAASAEANASPQVDDTSPSENISKLLKGKEKEWTETARKAPLRLLDLPVDILKEIIHQLPHTNDLTSLALCHSALHRLTIPCIYSRFDIVWPDESTHTEPRTGVDALTYGLATLVLAEDSFPHQNQYQQPGNSAFSRGHSSKVAPTPYPIPRRRFGNYYAQFTKKFSLGNGPAAWVQEYMIAKEGGKMLGTLVALAVARMTNLETFVWDMPTGVLRDVWLALSSLAHRTDGEECRLERLWIRWHDNTSLDSPGPAPPPPMILNNVPPPPNTTHPSGAGVTQAPVVVPVHYTAAPIAAIDRVEHPTFSVIPALKSLSVLDIDELPYLDEMSILIARSQKKLRELRVGIAPHAQQRDWVTAWEGENIQQVDYSTTWTAASSIGEKRLGGVLGILVGRVYNIRQDKDNLPKATKSTDLAERSTEATNAKQLSTNIISQIPHSASHDREPEQGADHVDGSPVQEGVSLVTESEPQELDPTVQSAFNTSSLSTTNGVVVPVFETRESKTIRDKACDASKRPASEPKEEILNGKLKLETLELERVPLAVTVMLKAFDWSILTTLTLLHCHNHEQLWKFLRRKYAPKSSYPTNSPSSSTRAYKASYTLRSEYSLNLKKIHTNTVSPSLISFLKEALAPNSLEVLFLQEGRSYSSTVTVDAIFRGPLKRHRASLKKLMIDSSEKGPDGHATSSSRWRRWMLNREIITFITSGRMSSLREIAFSIDYRDWHYFLQRLPLIPHIRSLYIPFIADHAHGNNIDPRELALQIVDIVHLRPDVEVCYMGISTKCFEILENRPSNYDLRHESMSEGPVGGIAGYVPNDPMMSDDESETTEDEEDDDLDGDVGGADEASESEMSDGPPDESDGEDSFLQEERKGPKLRLREILFYDDKVAIFKARSGTLR